MDEINYRIKWVPILFFLYSQAEGFDSQTNIIRQTKRLRVIFNKIKQVSCRYTQHFWIYTEIGTETDRGIGKLFQRSSIYHRSLFYLKKKKQNDFRLMHTQVACFLPNYRLLRR